MQPALLCDQQEPFVHMKYMDLHGLTCSILKLFGPVDPPPESPAPRENTLADTDAYTSQVLLHLGIPPHVQGYKFLRQAILSTLDTPWVLDNLTHSLYPTVARQFNTSAANTERSIRHAIDMAWTKHGPDVFRKLQPQGDFTQDACPTVREFLAMVTERVRIHLMRR